MIMTADAAKRIVCTIVSNSSFLRGYLEGYGAWGRASFPVDDEKEQLKNLSDFFTSIGTALKEKENKDLNKPTA